MGFLQNIRERVLEKVVYKFSIIFCSIYVVLFIAHAQMNTILFDLLLSFIVAIGIAGLGYAINDIVDLQKDIQNGKHNLFAHRSRLQSALLMVLLIAMSLFPWLFLPFDKISGILLGIEFLLFIVYALPPFRLKEKGLFGVIADALYAQTVPCLLAVYTFYKIGGIVFTAPVYIGIYGCWLTLTGIRNILNHQLDDYKNDTATQTKTFVTNAGISSARSLISWLMPAEIILFLAVLFFMPQTNHCFLYLYLAYIIFYTIRKKTTTNKIIVFDFLNQQLLNEFYEIHLPVLLLIYFSWMNPLFLVLLVLQLVLFLPIYADFIRGFIKKNLHR